MFKDKVGSDACLILTGTDDSGTITLDQTFTLGDITEALKTRVVEIAVFGEGTYESFIVTGIASGAIVGIGVAGTCSVEQDADGIWSGTIT